MSPDDRNRHQAELAAGTLSYRDSGTGEPIVFLHGLLVNGRLWEGVADRLSPDFRCIVPDLPLGSHSTPMRPDADLTPPGVARLVVDFLDSLGLDRVTLVGNDSGVTHLAAAWGALAALSAWLLVQAKPPPADARA